LAENFWEDPSQIPDGLRKCDWYLDTYGSAGYTSILQNIARNYRHYARDQVSLQRENGIDTISLATTRTIALRAQKIYSMFDHMGEFGDVEQTIQEINALRLIARKVQPPPGTLANP
jgi:hypothetical protein